MRFFETVTALNIIGIILFILGAVLVFGAKKLSANQKNPHAEILIKLLGLGLAISAFLLIIFG